MKLSVNLQIALTHIISRKKQTIIASLGVTIGIALYIFSNSIVVGVSEYTKKNLFKSTPHIRIYSEDELSSELGKNSSGQLSVIVNPSFTFSSRYITNSEKLSFDLETAPFVQQVAPNVTVDLFYKKGNVQLKGVANGVVVEKSDAMFNVQSTMLAGTFQSLSTDLNGIVIGKGIADKLNVRIGDQITVVSSAAVSKPLAVIGIFSTENKAIDESKSYLNINTAQKLLQESNSKVTDLFVKVSNPDSAIVYAQALQAYTEYKVEDWQAANADQLAQNKMLGTMTPLISFSILLVAAFGIYNIINMTITQKMNDIAILKANGFKAKDIVYIFVSESMIMGVLGTILGLLIGAGLVVALSNVYVGPPVGYFPVKLDPSLFFQGGLFGLLVSFGAGFMPARKAGKVDPVKIFRK